MTSRQAQAILQNIQYRPGWTLTVRDSRHQPGECLQIELSAKVPNAYSDAHETVDIVTRLDFPADLTVAALFNAAVKMIRDQEDHEFDEWFRYRGARVFDTYRGTGMHSPL